MFDFLQIYAPFYWSYFFSLESVWANKKDRMAWILKEIACFKGTLLYYECSVNNLSTFWSMITEAQPETCQQKNVALPAGWFEMAQYLNVLCEE